MSPVTVSRCVCQDQSFQRLAAAAARENWNLAELMARTGCGVQCGLCRPYLRRMLETGQTVFHEILVEPEPAAEGDSI